MNRKPKQPNEEVPYLDPRNDNRTQFQQKKYKQDNASERRRQLRELQDDRDWA